MQRRTPYQSHTQRREKRPLEKKACYYCVENLAFVDYKEVPMLRRFTSSYLKIATPRRSGLCAKHQRKVARAVKQARIAGLMGFLPR